MGMGLQRPLAHLEGVHVEARAQRLWRAQGVALVGRRQLEVRGGLTVDLEPQLRVALHHGRHGAHHLLVLGAHGGVEVLHRPEGRGRRQPDLPRQVKLNATELGRHRRQPRRRALRARGVVGHRARDEVGAHAAGAPLEGHVQPLLRHAARDERGDARRGALLGEAVHHALHVPLGVEPEVRGEQLRRALGRAGLAAHLEHDRLELVQDGGYAVEGGPVLRLVRRPARVLDRPRERRAARPLRAALDVARARKVDLLAPHEGRQLGERLVGLRRRGLERGPLRRLDLPLVLLRLLLARRRDGDQHAERLVTHLDAHAEGQRQLLPRAQRDARAVPHARERQRQKLRHGLDGTLQPDGQHCRRLDHADVVQLADV